MAAASTLSRMESTSMSGAFSATAGFNPSTSNDELDPWMLQYGRPFSPKLVTKARSVSFYDPSATTTLRAFLKDLGSGHGFMHNEQGFLYKCRRTFLHDDPEMSRLVPPIDFMSKAQLRRLLRIEEVRQQTTERPTVAMMKRWSVTHHESMSRLVMLNTRLQDSNAYGSDGTPPRRKVSGVSGGSSSSSSARTPVVLGKRRAKRRMMTQSQEEDRLRFEYEEESNWIKFTEFVSRDKSKQGGDASGGKRPAPSAEEEGPTAKASRMEWMMGPIPLLGRPKQPQAEELTPAEKAKKAAEEAEQKRIQEDIEKGLRDSSGLMYGVNYVDAPQGDGKGSGGGPQSSGGGGPAVVGDGGAVWRARALKRAKEEAHRTGRSLEEVVKERWGSLEELTKGLGRNGGGGRGGGDERRGLGWKRNEYRRRDDDEGHRRRQEDEGWRRVFQGESVERKPRLSLGRDQTDKDIISRFSQKLGEALGKVQASEDGGREGDEGARRRSDQDRDRDRERRRSRSRSRERGSREERRSRRDGDGGDDGWRRKGEGERDKDRGSRRRGEGQEPREGFSREVRRSSHSHDGDGDGRGRDRAEEERPSNQAEREKRDEVEVKKAEAGEEVGKPPNAESDEEGPLQEDRGELDEERARRERRERWQQTVSSFQRKVEEAPPPSARRPRPPSEPASVSATPPPPASSGGEEASAVDVNKLAAKALRAKLMKDMKTHDRLQKEIEEAKKAQQVAKALKAGQAKAAATTRPEKQAGGGKDREEEQPPAKAFQALDREGRPMELDRNAKLRREDLRFGTRKGKLKSNEQWTQDVDLEELVRREKAGGDDMDEVFAKNVMRLGSRFRGTEFRGGDGAGMDEEDQIDTRMFEKAEDRMTDKARQQRQAQRAINEHNKWAQAVSQCGLCMDSPAFKKHLMLSLGEHTFLSLRVGPQSLVPGQVAIVPVKHVESGTAMDEEVWSEVENFKASLRRMYANEGKAVLFLESALDLGRKRHTTIDCIPVPRTVDQDCPLYFKQGLMEVDEQWSTHRKLIDTTSKGIRKSVPKGFPYFHVEWSTGGYAHIVEDRDKFPRDFGPGVVAGMLGVDPPGFGKKTQRVSPEEEKRALQAFLKKFQPYDWTAELEGGEYVK